MNTKIILAFVFLVSCTPAAAETWSRFTNCDVGLEQNYLDGKAVEIRDEAISPRCMDYFLQSHFVRSRQPAWARSYFDLRWELMYIRLEKPVKLRW